MLGKAVRQTAVRAGSLAALGALGGWYAAVSYKEEERRRNDWNLLLE